MATVLSVLLVVYSGTARSGVPESASSSSSSTSSAPAPRSPGAGLPFTPYQGSEVLGEGNLTIGSPQGKPLVLNFWAGLCLPCGSELPDLQEFYKENKDRVNILGIDVGQFTGLGNQDSAKALLEK